MRRAEQHANTDGDSDGLGNTAQYQRWGYPKRGLPGLILRYFILQPKICDGSFDHHRRDLRALLYLPNGALMFRCEHLRVMM